MLNCNSEPLNLGSKFYTNFVCLAPDQSRNLGLSPFPFRARQMSLITVTDSVTTRDFPHSSVRYLGRVGRCT